MSWPWARSSNSIVLRVLIDIIGFYGYFRERSRTMDGIGKAGRSPVGLFSRRSFSPRAHCDFRSDTVAVSKNSQVGVSRKNLLTKSPLTVFKSSQVGVAQKTLLTIY
jgi:hypothetical protein